MKWMHTMFTFYPPELLSNMNFIYTDTLHPTYPVHDWVCKQAGSPVKSFLPSHLLISHSSTQPQCRGDAVSFFNPERSGKGKHDGSYSLSGDGLRAEFVRGGGNNRCDGDGPVGDGGPLWQHCDSCVLVCGPVEVMCPRELRLHRVQTLFYHSGTARYFYLYTVLLYLEATEKYQN